MTRRYDRVGWDIKSVTIEPDSDREEDFWCVVTVWCRWVVSTIEVHAHDDRRPFGAPGIARGSFEQIEEAEVERFASHADAEAHFMALAARARR